jgi:ribose transport system substrate-binding protein
MNRRGFALSVLAGVVLYGCGGKNDTQTTAGTPSSSGTTTTASNSGDGATIGVSLSSRQHNFFLGMEQGVMEGLEANGLKADVQVADDSASNQQQQIDTFARKGVKAIVMVPVDAKLAVACVEIANKANIPIFCIDRRVTDPSAKVTSTIETDNVAMGEEAAKHGIALLCKRKGLDPNKPEDLKKLTGKVVHLWGKLEASSAQDRAAGIDKVLATTGLTPIKVVGDFVAKKAQEEMAPVLTANPDIELILCHNDDNAIGAYNAILDIKKAREPANDPKRIILIGMDGNKPAIEKIRAGEIEATVTQEPLEMGKTTIVQVKKVLDGGQPDKPYIPIPHRLITQKEAGEMQGKLWSDQLKTTAK